MGSLSQHLSQFSGLCFCNGNLTPSGSLGDGGIAVHEEEYPSGTELQKKSKGIKATVPRGTLGSWGVGVWSGGLANLNMLGEGPAGITYGFPSTAAGIDPRGYRAMCL